MAEIKFSEVKWIRVSQEKLSKFFTKPKLAEKLLRKPPVRYVRDILNSILRASGFPQGVFTDLVIKAKPADIKAWTRDQKVGFLYRLHKAVEIAVGRTIEFSAEKASQGAEPENTNAVLQGLADGASLLKDGQISMDKIISECQGMGWGGPAEDPSKAEAMAAEAAAKAAAVKKAKVDAEAKARAENAAAAAKAKAEAAKNAKREAALRAKAEREKAEQEAAAMAAKDSQKSSRKSSRSSARSGDAGLRVEVPESLPAAVALSRELLSPLIKRPSLNDKFLSRPPVRYIHDVLINIVKETGLFIGLFSDEELDPKEFKGADKRKKSMVIKKLLRCASAAVGQNLPIKLKDIFQGIEADKTNMLFHAIAKAAVANVASDVIKARLQGRAPSPASRSKDPSPATRRPPRKASQGSDAPAKAQEKDKDEVEKNALNLAGAAGGDSERTKGDKPSMPRLNIHNIASKPPEEATAAYHAVANAAAEEQDKELRSARPTTRPMTARRAPPKLRSHLVEEKKKAIADNDAESMGLITEDNMGEDMDEDEEEEDGVMEGINGLPTEGPDANEKHGKLVSDILKFQGKFERKGGVEKKEAVEEGEGQGIRFGRLRKKKGGSNKGFYSEEQILFLREKIQQLCQSATPLGKCIEYVCEDMESMNKELHKWKRAYETETQIAQKTGKEQDEALAPLYEKLKSLDNDIRNEQDKCTKLQAQIRRNEKTIEAHLRAQSGM
uniref:TRAF3-interacting protein 1 N-terminal domain-containing protein n=1 Tax=Lotharella globosa TaxID=91324 RepID=A0A7S3ZCY3_9EUKA|mmetsp:Transcript_4886/g.9579  ORF Transcript_4886/g.9579 Transcript_4886/m.9579 type:complete len:727 (-) Transcript_4886:38-2218(-)